MLPRECIGRFIFHIIYISTEIPTSVCSAMFLNTYETNES